MNSHKRIIDNLANRVDGVNFHCATSGIENQDQAVKALQELIDGGRVECRHIHFQGGNAPLYRLVPRFPTKLSLVVNN